MKFLLDQDVYVSTLRLLKELGRDIIPVAQIGLAQASDEELLKKAQQENRIAERSARSAYPLKGLISRASSFGFIDCG